MTSKTLSFFLVLMLSANAFSQDFNIAATAGYLNLNSIFKVDGKERNLDFKSSGFYIGAQSEIGLSEKINLQPELLIGFNSEGNTLYLGVLGGFEVIENASVLAGPSISYLLEEPVQGYSKLGVFATFGVQYGFTQKIYAQAKYGLQVNDFYDGSADVSSKVNYLLLGVAYRFL